jgi:hypothetical protein
LDIKGINMKMIRTALILTIVTIGSVVGYIPTVHAASEGFMGLKWGASPKEARKQFNDLVLAKSPPKKLDGKSLNLIEDYQQFSYEYKRKNETFMLGELTPDEVTYEFFNNERFVGAVAAKKFFDLDKTAALGTYAKEKNKFAASYLILKNNIEAKYGEPKESEDSSGYSATWETPEVVIMLSLVTSDETENLLSLVFGISSKLRTKLENSARSKKLPF